MAGNSPAIYRWEKSVNKNSKSAKRTTETLGMIQHRTLCRPLRALSLFFSSYPQPRLVGTGLFSVVRYAD